MRINTNILSLNAQRNLSQVSKAIARSLERLSSGKRLNSARDDASGLAMNSRLEAQLRSQRRGLLNLNESQGYLATADGVLSTQTDIVQRMRELALQSANGTLSVQDRKNLDNEFQALFEEYNRISDQAEFNGVSLLNDSFGDRQIQLGANKEDVLDVTLPSSLSDDIFTSIRGAGTFTESQTIYTGNVNARLATADFDGDGNQDFIATNPFATSISISFGRGDGTFDERVTYDAGVNSNYAFTKDLDGDGAEDIVLSVGNSSVVTILWNNGEGQFNSSTTFSANGTVANIVDAIKFADINGDGLVDMGIATTGPSANFILNRGNRSFTFESSVILLGAAGQVGRIEFGELDGDGKVDALISNTSTGLVRRLLGQGDGTFANAVLLPQLAAGKLLDVDEDGDLDVVGFDSFTNSQIRVLLNNGAGTFGSATDYDVLIGDPAGFSINVADMDGDGILDLVTGNNSSQNLQIVRGNGQGGFETASIVSTPGITFTMAAVADFNNDEINDLLDFGSGLQFVRVLLQNTQNVSAVSQLDITNQANAQASLEILDHALNTLVSGRAQIGAIQNRLEFAENGAVSLIENLSMAKSQLEDADLAAEVAELTRLQVLQEAATSVLSQSNLSLQMVLRLLTP